MKRQCPGVTVSSRMLINTIQQYSDYKVVATQKIASGKRDEKSDWATTRRIYCRYVLKLLSDNCVTIGNRPNAEDRKMSAEGILFIDKTHSKCTYGGGGHQGVNGCIQWLVSTDEKGSPRKIKEGGKCQREESECSRSLIMK